jgi:HD superfamily phosphohydrolase YqeK
MDQWEPRLFTASIILEDDEIYQAVCWHTTVHVDMSDVAKVVFLADKLDPQKEGRYPYLTQLKEIAMESLDRAMLEFFNRDLCTFVR